MENEDQIIGKIGIDDDGVALIKEPIMVKLSSYKNSKYLDIRKVYDKNGEWLPTTKGITLHKEQIKELIDILQSNIEQINAWFE